MKKAPKNMSYCYKAIQCTKRNQCERSPKRYIFDVDYIDKYMWINAKDCIENNHFLFREIENPNKDA